MYLSVLPETLALALSNSFGLFGLSQETVSIFTWVQLSVRLLTLKLGNNYHEAAP